LTTPEIERAMNASDLFIFEVPVDEAALQDQKAFIIEHGLLRCTNPCGAFSPQRIPGLFGGVAARRIEARTVRTLSPLARRGHVGLPICTATIWSR